MTSSSSSSSTLILLLVVVAASATTDDAFSAFTTRFSKEYASPVERAARADQFAVNLARIHAHNREYIAGRETFYLGVNEFADRGDHEMTGLLGYRYRGGTAADWTHEQGLDPLPESIDWRQAGLVTRVKNQASCGSCWSFSATGCMEAAHARATGALVELSEQQLVDCVDGGADNCTAGGEMSSAFRYAITAGADSERAYPYRATSGHRCKDARFGTVATFAAFVNISEGDEGALMHALARHPGVSVAIDASGFEFRMYQGGVYTGASCGPITKPGDLNHGVLAVGYGSSDDGGDYWIVKNSWGQLWGDNGYIKMARNRLNRCGIASDASYVLVGEVIGAGDVVVAAVE